MPYERLTSRYNGGHWKPTCAEVNGVDDVDEHRTHHGNRKCQRIKILNTFDFSRLVVLPRSLRCRHYWICVPPGRVKEKYCVGVRKEEQRGHGKEGRQEGGREERVEKASFAVHLIIQPLRLCASRDHARFPHRRHRPSYYSLYTFITLYLLKYRARASEKA